MGKKINDGALSKNPIEIAEKKRAVPQDKFLKKNGLRTDAEVFIDSTIDKQSRKLKVLAKRKLRQAERVVSKKINEKLNKKKGE